MRVIRCSGDYNDQVGAFLRGNMIWPSIITYEMFLQLVVGNPYTLGQLGLIVIDEAQFITDPTRESASNCYLRLFWLLRKKG